MLRSTWLSGLALLIGLAAATTPSRAQKAWPEKPVKLVVAYSAGSTGDLVVRALSEQVREQAGETLVVENRAGADGKIATASVVNAAADGYTLLVGAANNFVINKFLYENLGFDPTQALSPIITLVDVPAVLFVNAATPSTSLAEFVAMAKASGGEFNYASPGLGTPPHLASEAINRATGMGLHHVVYRGSPLTIAALLANDVQLVLAGGSAGIEHVMAGELKVLAVGGPDRLLELPQVLALRELGLGKIKASTWWAVAAPRDTPPAVIAKLNSAFAEAIAQPVIRAKLQQMGTLPIGGTIDRLNHLIEGDLEYWRATLPSLGGKLK